MNLEVIRDKNLKKLFDYGFSVSTSLPISDSGLMRSYKEIATRLYALDALVCWVVFNEEQTSSERIRSYIHNNGLSEFFTSTETEILSLERTTANELYADTIGWRLENMWALSWVLGFKIEPSVLVGQLPDEVTRAMVYDFLPGLDSSISDLLSTNRARSIEEVIELEDLYYCTHNAVRSAQLGENTVPSNYHPIIDGGAVHERRHSLTWCISPNVEWSDVDLST